MEDIKVLVKKFGTIHIMRMKKNLQQHLLLLVRMEKGDSQEI